MKIVLRIGETSDCKIILVIILKPELLKIFSFPICISFNAINNDATLLIFTLTRSIYRLTGKCHKLRSSCIIGHIITLNCCTQDIKTVYFLVPVLVLKNHRGIANSCSIVLLLHCNVAVGRYNGKLIVFSTIEMTELH